MADSRTLTGTYKLTFRGQNGTVLRFREQGIEARTVQKGSIMSDEAQTQVAENAPQSNEELETLKQQLQQTQEELKNTNAYVTKLQQGVAQPGEDDDEAIDEAVTPEQKRLVRKLAGTDEATKKLEELQQQLVKTQWKNDLKAISDRFPKTDGFPAVDEKEIANFMQEKLIGDPESAYRLLYQDKIAAAHNAKAEKQAKAAKTDSGDSPVEAKGNDEEYRKAVAELKANGGNMDDLVALRKRFGRNIPIN